MLANMVVLLLHYDLDLDSVCSCCTHIRQCLKCWFLCDSPFDFPTNQSQVVRILTGQSGDSGQIFISANAVQK